MPRISLNRRKYILADLYKYIYAELYERGTTQTELGKKMGYTQQCISNKLVRRSLTVPDLIFLFEFLGTPPEKVGELLKGKK